MFILNGYCHRRLLKQMSEPGRPFTGIADCRHQRENKLSTGEEHFDDERWRVFNFD